MYPGKVYEFLDADREGVGCSPPQLGHPDEDLDDEAPDDEAAWHLWYLTFVVHVSPTVSPALDTEQTAWGNFVDGWDKKDDEDEKDDGDDDAEDNEEDDGETNRTETDSCSQLQVRRSTLCCSLKERRRCPSTRTWK